MKKIEFKPLILTVALIAFQSICYFVSKLLGGSPHLIGGFIDDKIPFNMWFIIPYCIWYVLIFLIPYYIYKKDKDLFVRYIVSYTLCTIVANIIFIVYPTYVDRPVVSGNGVLEFITKVVFAVDTPPQNCFPSLHCAVSMLFVLYMFRCKECPLHWKVCTFIIAIMIMVGTLFVKQHVLIDLISGDVIALFIYLVVSKINVSKIKELLCV